MTIPATAEDWALTGKIYRCPKCGCQLEPYEVFACRIRGLNPPCCLGCLIDAVVDVREKVWPLLKIDSELLARV